MQRSGNSLDRFSQQASKVLREVRAWRANCSVMQLCSDAWVSLYPFSCSADPFHLILEGLLQAKGWFFSLQGLEDSSECVCTSHRVLFLCGVVEERIKVNMLIMLFLAS